jgi:hypothetical protein
MLSKMQSICVVPFGAAFVILLSAGPAPAQRPRPPRPLAVLQQQTAFQQQQTAVQTAIQQTTFVLQSAYHQNSTRQQGQNDASAQTGTPYLVNLQLQQNALQIALQQTTALLQASFRQNSALSQTALQQLNVLQNAQQQTTAVQSALAMQNGQWTVFQLQTMSQEQASLMGLLSSQPPALSSRTSRR